MFIIFDTSLQLGKIPDAWRLALVTPIYKNKGSKKNAENYRPVSLTSIACRIMESIIRDAFLRYSKANKFISEKQFGFLGGRSTVLQLLKVIDHWTEILDTGGIVDVIYCDFQKAFDTVPHKRLMEVVKYYGASMQILTWIEDFLANRKLEVCVDGCRSDGFEAISGVPQGSVLGPFLFVLYINILVSKSNAKNLFLYADDLKIYREIKCNEDKELLQSDLDTIYDWTQYSLLRLHPGKCVSMRIASKNKREIGKCNYNMDSYQLETVAIEKDLGVIVDNNLSFQTHIEMKVKNANKLVGLLRRSFTHLDGKMFKQLFISIVRPHLEYCASVWNPYLKKNIELIENVQRRATKQVAGLSHMSYKDRLKSIDLPTLKYRRYRGDMIEVYKIAHDMYDTSVTKDFLDFSASRSRGHNLRRHKFDLIKVIYKKDVRKFSFRSRIVDQWNYLPSSIVDAPNLNLFKNKLDRLWMRENLIYEPDVDIYERTTLRRMKV